jgi:antitoxin (DNA-binding transcriptional repressor) of toxin-antitoxin stability system
MKTVDARDLQHHLGSYLDQVAAGETLEIRRRRKVMARILPCVAEDPAEPWPDVSARLAAVYPDGEVSPGASDILYRDRGD